MPSAKKGATTLNIEGRELAVSNLQKVLYPSVGFTKGDVINYYINIAPFLLPHLKSRALTLKRYPDGVDGFFFYEKKCPSHRPRWVKTAKIVGRRSQEEKEYCLANDLPSLVWAANLADLELHTSLALSKNPDRPTMMVYDLDPGEGMDIVACAQVALWLREKLEGLELQSFVKTSGSKGLQLYIPLNTPVDFDDGTKPFSHELANLVAAEHPDEVVTNMRKDLRKRKVLIDWSQNDRHKTTICAYSLRAKQQPTVSMPLFWEEVEALRKTKKPERVAFLTDAAVARAKKHGDIFEPVLTLKQKLPKKVKHG